MKRLPVVALVLGTLIEAFACTGAHGASVPDSGAAVDAGADAGVLSCPSCTAFVNGMLFDGTDAGPGFLVISANDGTGDGGKIVAVGFGDAALAVGTVVDLTGKTLLPGLIDAHTHLFAAAGPRGWSPPESLIDDHLKAFLRSGVTSILDLGSPAEEIFTYRARINAGALRGPNIFAAGPFLTPTGGHPCYSGEATGDLCSFVDAPSDVTSTFAWLLPLQPDVIKLVLEPGLGITLPELSDPDIGAIQMAATAARVTPIAHVFKSADVLTLLGQGLRALAHVPGYDAMTPAMAAAVADAGAITIPTISFGLGYVAVSMQQGPWLPDGGGASSDAGVADAVSGDVLAALANPAILGETTTLPYQQAYEAILANEQGNFALELDAGVRFIAGTDCGNPADFHGLSMAPELAQYVALGMTPMQALHSATAAGADWLGHPEVGHLAVGARADLLIVDGDATSNIAALARVDQVYKDGVQLDRAALSVATGSSLVLSPVTGLDAGALCLELPECAAGLTCALGAQRCELQCGDGGACPFGSACFEDPNGGPSFCYAGTGCSLVPQACSNDAACEFQGNGATDCVTASASTLGQSCSLSVGCARGLQCSPTLKVCETLCALDAGCPGTEMCVSEQQSADLPVGFCE